MIVAWDGAWPTVALRLPEGGASGGAAAGRSRTSNGRVMVELVLEDGERLRVEINPSKLSANQRAIVEERRFCEYGLSR